MTDDLDALRPEVLEAMRCVTAPFDPFTADSPLSSPGSELHNARIVAAELLHLQREEDRLHKAACKQLRRAQKAEAELAAIKARIAGSPRADGQRVFDLLGLPIEYDGTLALVKVED